MSSAVLANPGEPTFGVVPALDLSALGQCWNGTLEVGAALELQGFPRERWHLRRNPYLRDDDKLPCAMVSHYGIRTDNAAGTNNETAVHYLFLVALHWAGGRTAINGEAEALNALERLYVAFSKRPRGSLASISINAEGACLRDVRVDQADALNQEAFRIGALVKFVIVDWFVRLPYREGL
jgi:hypothetical protein